MLLIEATGRCSTNQIRKFSIDPRIQEHSRHYLISMNELDLHHPKRRALPEKVGYVWRKPKNFGKT